MASRSHGQLSGGKVIDPETMAAYLEGKFGDDLKAVRAAMERLAKTYEPAELRHAAYTLYRWFWPAARGQEGLGREGLA